MDVKYAIENPTPCTSTTVESGFFSGIIGLDAHES